MYDTALACDIHMLSSQGLMRILYIYKSTKGCGHTEILQARPCMLSVNILVEYNKKMTVSGKIHGNVLNLLTSESVLVLHF